MKKYSIIKNITEVPANSVKGVITPGSKYDDNNTERYTVIEQFNTFEEASAALKGLCGSVAAFYSGGVKYYSVEDFAVVDCVTADGHIIDTDESIDCFDIWDFAEYDRNDTLPEEEEEE